MNERIKQLAEQVANGMLSYDAEGDWRLSEKEVEKFAELIVRECADISDASFHNGSAGYTAILKHFGIEP